MTIVTITCDVCGSNLKALKMSGTSKQFRVIAGAGFKRETRAENVSQFTVTETPLEDIQPSHFVTCSWRCLLAFMGGTPLKPE